MKIIALVSFVGEVSMAKGETRDVPDAIGKDLVNAGHAVKAGEKKKAEADESVPEKKAEATVEASEKEKEAAVETPEKEVTTKPAKAKKATAKK